MQIYFINRERIIARLHKPNRREQKMKNEDVIEYAPESDNTFSGTNESEDISLFFDLADDELMLQAVFSRC